MSTETRHFGMPGLDGREPFIVCQDLFKIYKRADLEVVALRGLNLAVQSGELIAAVGASGSGKSTFLNILAGLDRPSAGQVRVGGRDLLNVSDRDLVEYRRRDVGFVWQATGRNLLPYLTVSDNVELPMALSGQPRRHRRAWAGELLAALDVADKAERLPHELSGGEQQRVAIAVALSNRPPLLLADEPTGELDNANAVQVFELLRELSRNYGVTVVIVTHYPAVSMFVDRVVHIRDGNIGSETHTTMTFQREGSHSTYEYIVVDPSGRLQLPQEYVDRFGSRGLARMELGDGRITLGPAEGHTSEGREECP